MKRIIIICEGQTEKEFCNDVLQPYFNTKGIFLETPLIKKSNGGIVPWKFLKEQIDKHLKQDANVVVTTFIDFYGIVEHHNFPNWLSSKSIIAKEKRLENIENAMKDVFEDAIKFRFVPYIQL